MREVDSVLSRFEARHANDKPKPIVANPNSLYGESHIGFAVPLPNRAKSERMTNGTKIGFVMN